MVLSPWLLNPFPTPNPHYHFRKKKKKAACTYFTYSLSILTRNNVLRCGNMKLVKQKRKRKKNATNAQCCVILCLPFKVGVLRWYMSTGAVQPMPGTSKRSNIFWGGGNRWRSNTQLGILHLYGWMHRNKIDGAKKKWKRTTKRRG